MGRLIGAVKKISVSVRCIVALHPVDPRRQMSAKLPNSPDIGDPMKKPLGQRIAFAMAILCYAAAVASAFAAFLYQSPLSDDPVRASLIAAVVFFVGCGAVLHIIGTARLTGVLSGSGHIDDD